MPPSDDALLDPLDPAAPRPLVQRLGVILWPSFMVAGAMSALFFALVDPLALRPGRALGRELGYTLGFFMFWSATLSSSLLTEFLQRPPPQAAADDDAPSS
ncbi:hypothetical protein A6R71_00265 [Xanthomonas translucens pv. arrhenatheri]|jgi:hypothetical protein|uniref:Transmembrane protein n=2 Tax=Xanthomonas graminis TaxID=3390026 RepID=A0A1M4JGX3_9XANT|nr:hypothetical protein [Xanthomonas translucens]EKU25361.1 hypothetical protein XTG29_01659 [Xanthomonas translucens pv. graminis ART-Xtg29]OAX59072.1 hypothetical protein A6R72_02785 [Xanthomonas translucens pv. graminis]OAX66356.1 hypothetical protein A6R71_00265 [Xanthomonas translucens pv. arrhenatheri]UKE53161.1 hypothetical protein KFS84_12250 [Xanthomonas translucens pv. graminis]UKE79183.1 hypothetical protein KM317_08255 [Xanthomonas translucens pv. arrhenatheri]